MKIGIDIDGVIADFVGTFLPLLNRYCKCKLEDIVNYDFEKNIDIKEEEIKKVWREVEKKKIYAELALIEGSRNALRKLSRNNTIFLISSRKQKFYKYTIQWLKRNKIVYAELKLVNSAKEKITEMNKCDIILEDSLEVSRMLAARGIRVILFDYPWNRIGRKNIKRVKNWSEAIEQIGLYKKANRSIP